MTSDWEIIEYSDIPYAKWELLELNLEEISNIWKPIDIYNKNSPSPDFQILLLGPCNVGKTLLLQTMKNKKYKEEIYKSTLGVTYEDFYFKDKDNDNIMKIRVYDSSSDVIYKNVILTYVEYCDIILLINNEICDQELNHTAQRYNKIIFINNKKGVPPLAEFKQLSQGNPSGIKYLKGIPSISLELDVSDYQNLIKLFSLIIEYGMFLIYS